MPHLCAVYGCSHNSKRERGLFKFYRFPSVIWNQGEETRKLGSLRYGDYRLRTTAGRALSFVRSTGLSRANIER